MPAVPKPPQSSNPMGYTYPQGLPENVESIPALQKQVAQLQREQAKVQDLLSSLSFSLRSFNNLNQFLALIPLIVSRVTDADAAALILFRPNGQISIEHLYCHESQWCRNIRHTLETATRNLQLQSNPQQSFGEQLERRFQQLLGQDYCWLTTTILVRNLEPHERGRLYLFSHQKSYTWTDTHQKLTQLVADQTAVAIENDELSNQLRRQERLTRELEIGAEIQARLFPNRCPHIDGVELAATCKTANQVGGDYYDFIPMNLQPSEQQSYRFPQAERWSLVIGDVMGKGVPAGLIMTMTRGILRNDIINQHPPAQILQNLNQVMFTDLENSNRFVTLFYSDYEPRSRILRYSNAAHHPPLIWKAETNTIERLDTDGMLIGLDINTTYQESQVQLSSGDTIIFYTDGFTDAANPTGERFGEENLIKAFWSACHTCISPQMILEQLFDTVQTFIGPHARNQDDMTLIVLRAKRQHLHPIPSA